MTSQSSAHPVSLEEKPTICGWLLCLVGLSFFLSAFPGLRPSILGLSIHPYLLVLGLLFIAHISSRRSSLVQHSLGGWGAVVIIGVSLSYLANGDMTGSTRSIMKWATMLFTFALVARGLRNPADLRIGVLGLMIGIGLIGFRALLFHQNDPAYYLNAFRGISSRNSFSMWSLLPLAFGLWELTLPNRSRRRKLLVLVLVVVMGLTQLMSLSRTGSGLLPLSVIFVLLARRSFRPAIVATVLSIFLFAGVQYFDFSLRIQDRLTTVTQGGTTSDGMRKDIIFKGIEIFSENPIFGVSSHRLSVQLGQALRDGAGLSSHNLFIELLAGNGLVTTIAFLMCGLILLKRWRAARNTGQYSWSEYADIQPVLVLLVMARAFTADEVIYCPAVMMGLALAFSAANHAIAAERAELEAAYGRVEAESASAPSNLRVAKES